MTQQEILEFINKNQACTLATCDGNKPHVRGDPLAVFRVQKMTATVWTMAANLTPKEYIELK